MKSLKELREEKGLTQVQASIALGISYQGYRFYETGYYIKMKPSLEEKISELFGVEYHYIR